MSDKTILGKLFLYRHKGGNYVVVDVSKSSKLNDTGSYFSKHIQSYVITAPIIACFSGKYVEEVFGKHLLELGDRQTMVFVWFVLRVFPPKKRPLKFICGLAL